ncbi:MAG: hypothetical protein COA58_09350 [Bacteroidetes bacterium]|nr:MAG: hypothetical protein COA58_09350 [Bacteroidota bacterium]
MKKILITLILFLSIGELYAQLDTIFIDTEYNDTCHLWKNVEVRNRYKLEMDINWRDIDLTDGVLVDDTLLYHSNKTIKYKKGEDMSRLIYFVHGIGGSVKSWSAVSDIHDQEYVYHDDLIEYVDFQRDFKAASGEVQKQMILGKNTFLDIDFSVTPPAPRREEYGRPYAIGHSQGGLVLRALDMRYNTSLYGKYNESDRKFWGFITVGSPNAGARIAISMDEVDKLSADLVSKLAAPEILNLLNNTNIKIPFKSKRFNKLYNKANLLVNDIVKNLVKEIAGQLTKDKRDPIAKQFGPDSKYLSDTLNHTTPTIAKAAFYAREDDPIFWRIATYMIGKDPYDYAPFGANDDGALAENMIDLELKYIAEAYSTKIQIKNHKSRIAKCKWWKPWKCIGKKNLQDEVDSLTREEDAWNEGADFLSKVNLSYKVILGAVDPNNMYKQETVGYTCYYRAFDWMRFSQLPKSMQNNPTIRAKYYYDASRTVKNASDCNGGYRLEPIVETTLIEIPTDATVPVPSQKALPGCVTWHIREMNEVLDHDNPDWNNVTIRSGVNHMQERNCDQTDAMLRRIYEGFGTPEFFILERR